LVDSVDDVQEDFGDATTCEREERRDELCR